MIQRTSWGLVIAVGAWLALAGRTATSHIPERRVALTYAATVSEVPPEAREVRLWMPLAKTRENQRVLSRRVRSAHPFEVRQDPVFGNDVLYVTLAAPLPPTISLSVDYVLAVRGEPLRRAADASTRALPAEARTLALRDEPYMVVNETITRLAQQATAGTTDELQKARALYDYVLAHMAYDKTAPGWGQGDTLRACRLGKGNCTDFHSLFISMARAVGIPSQFVIGASLPEEPEGEIPGYHCWAEFYTPQHGWVAVDASEAWKHPQRRDYYFGTRDPHRVLISVGRNLRLDPAQAGSPINMLIDPYVEVDGAPFGTVETRLSFTNHQQEEA